jgi:hypothetical protein
LLYYICVCSGIVVDVSLACVGLLLCHSGHFRFNIGAPCTARHSARFHLTLNAVLPKEHK